MLKELLITVMPYTNDPLDNEFKSFNTTLLEIENQIGKIETITKELDSWSIELTSKVKKL